MAHVTYAETEIKARAESEALAHPSKGAEAGRGCWWPEVDRENRLWRMRFKGFATGKNVVIAVLDSGIDVAFPGFFHVSADASKRTSFESRILGYWDPFLAPSAIPFLDRAYFWMPDIQKLKTQTKQLFADCKISDPIGTVFLKDDIEEYLAACYPKVGAENLRFFPSRDTVGHGTACAALAASHGFAVAPSAPIGVAPEAGIIAVKVTTQCAGVEISTWGGDEVKEGKIEPIAWKLAEKLSIGRALVFSRSLGLLLDFPYHENDKTQAYEDYFKDQAGVVLSNSAGNEGYRPNQLHFTTRGSNAETNWQVVRLPLRDARDGSDLTDPMDYCGVKSYRSLNSDCAFYVTYPASASLKQLFLDRTPVLMVLDPSGKPITFKRWGSPGVETNRLLGRGDPDYEMASPIDIGGLFGKVSIDVYVKEHKLPGSQPNETVVAFWLHLKHIPHNGNAAAFPKVPKGDFPFWVALLAPGGLPVSVQASADCNSADKARFGWFIDGGPKDGDTSSSPDGSPQVQPTWSGPAVDLTKRHRITDVAALECSMAAAATVLNKPDEILVYSSQGPIFEHVEGVSVPDKPTVSAPGTDIIHPVPALPSWHENIGFAVTPHETSWGTSMACPLISGAAALVLDRESSLTQSEVEGVLRAGADNRIVAGDPGSAEDKSFAFKANHGAGRLRVFDAVAPLVKP